MCRRSFCEEEPKTKKCGDEDICEEGCENEDEHEDVYENEECGNEDVCEQDRKV